MTTLDDSFQILFPSFLTCIDFAFVEYCDRSLWLLLLGKPEKPEVCCYRASYEEYCADVTSLEDSFSWMPAEKVDDKVGQNEDFAE